MTTPVPPPKRPKKSNNVTAPKPKPKTKEKLYNTIDPRTGKPTGKYQTEKYDTFDPETRTFRDEPVLVGASTEKGKKGFN